MNSPMIRELTGDEVTAVSGGKDSLVGHVISSAGQGAAIGAGIGGTTGAVVGGAVGAVVGFIAHLFE
jgi:hypothetical protein